MSPFTWGSSSTIFIKWIYRELRKTTSFGRVRYPFPKYPHQGKNNGFFLMRFLKIETKCSPKKNQLAKFSRPKTAEKGCCCFFRKGILSTKRRLWTNPRIFHTFCWWSKQASQTASNLGCFQVCFQTRSAWHWSLPPFVWEISGSALVVLCIKKKRILRHQPQKCQFPVHHWLIICGVALGIQMDSLLVAHQFKSCLSWFLLSTEAMDFWRVEHAIHGRWY